MNKLEGIAAIGAFALSTVTGCFNSDEIQRADDSFVVTEAALPWYRDGHTILRQSRTGLSTCIENNDFQDVVVAGDRVELNNGIDLETVDGCLPPEDVSLIREERDELTRVICEVEGSVDQLKYLDLVYGIGVDTLTGLSWTAENSNYTWWESEGDVQDMVNPPIVSTREDPEYGTLNTYSYEFSIPTNLIDFAFENQNALYPDTYIAANYWPNSNSAFYLSFEDCRIED